MARHGDTRSPSPVGSSYSSSKRSRKDEDRYRSRRDDGRSHRHGTRSRSPEVRDTKARLATGQVSDFSHEQRRRRDRDRDRFEYRRRDHSVERRYDDRRGDYSRRDRSRDLKRSRDHDDRRRSRDRDIRPRRDDSRDRNRLSRDGSADSRRKRRREDSPDRGVRKDSAHASHEVSPLPPLLSYSAQTPRQTSKPSTPTINEIDEKKAARLAKLEAWKKKQAEEQAKKQQELASAGGARSLLREIDKRDALTPTASSPQSPDTPDVASPAPYAGKFDPKAVAKKAHASSTSKGVLGADIAAPKIINGTSASKLIPGPRPASPLTNVPSSLKPKGNLSGFGLATKSTTEIDKSKSNLDFDDDESDRKKLAKIPSLPTNATNGTMADSPNGHDDAEDDGDHDLDMHEDEADEGALAAARAAAEQRSQAERGDDTTMTEAPAVEADAMDEAEEEDVDPLDAFMSDLTAVPAKPGRQTNGPTAKSKRQQEPEAIYSDDDVDVTAMDEDNPDSIMNAANEKIRKKKRDIPAIDHTKMNYEPFRRSFYSEPADMADWTEEEVLNLRHELDGIKVRGVDVPKPVQNWAQCGLGVQTLDVIQKLGYEFPTSIQAQAIPAIMSGRDVIGVAKTGSGKTVAFLLPMLRHIKDQRPLEGTDGPIGLILSPTRELATQIHKECKPFAKALGLRAVCAYGGAPIKDQIADLKRGAEIVVCTVGRMIDLLAANAGRVTNLRRVTYVVLDEADRMFDMGFEPQVMKIMANVRPDRQTVLFSATFPRNMEALARKTLSKPVEIIVGGRSVVAPEITQLVEVRNEDQKFHRLLELLGNLYEHEENADDRALIFVNRQESADLLLRDLMRKGYPCMSIHGGKDQIDRDSTIDDFKAGIVPILIATSVAARGLDVKQLKLVVNYDAPNHLEDYVHRAGRTGRAGNKGTAVTFLTSEEERYSVDIAKALRQSGQPVPEQIQKMVESFIEKVKSGKEKASGSGFGGKGLERLDQERDATKARERKTFKTGDEPDEEEKDEKDDEKTDEQFLKAASTVKALEEKPAQLAGVPKGIDLDGEITVNKTVRETAAGPVGKMDKVAAAVAGINNKLSKAGVMRQGVPIDNKGPDAGAFHATLEINDFPQKARWAVTNRTNVAKILDSTGTSITTKGNYYPTGKDPGPNDAPKLYILVEGDTELVVKEAMREMMRLLKEGTMAAADSDGGRTAGRYSVV
jgi:ATP-dependent RNA helicase DDX46/PRP5